MKLENPVWHKLGLTVLSLQKSRQIANHSTLCLFRGLEKAPHFALLFRASSNSEFAHHLVSFLRVGGTTERCVHLSCRMHRYGFLLNISQGFHRSLLNIHLHVEGPTNWFVVTRL